MGERVFISYSTQDAPLAEAVCASLEKQGIPCWIAPRDVPPGMHYGEAIVSAIADARALVVVFSAHANGSPHVLREVERAVARNVQVVPFRIGDVTPTASMEYLLSSPHWLNASARPTPEDLRGLTEALRARTREERTESRAPRKPHLTHYGVLLVTATQVCTALLLFAVGMIFVEISIYGVAGEDPDLAASLAFAAIGAFVLGALMVAACVGLFLLRPWGRIGSILLALANVPLGFSFIAVTGSWSDAGPHIQGFSLVGAVLSLIVVVILFQPRVAAYFAAGR